MPQATELEDLTHTLGYTQFTPEYKSKIVKANMTDKGKGRELTLPDGLALLLVDKQNRGVAAVSIRRTENMVYVLYAMDEDAAAGQAGVLDEVIAIANGIVAAEAHEMKDIRNQLLAIPPRYCRQKMDRRRDKLYSAWTDAMEDSSLELRTPSIEELAALRGNAILANADLTPSTWSAWLREWFATCVSRPFFTSENDAPLPSQKDIVNVLATCRLLRRLQLFSGSSSTLEKRACLRRRILKLSHYLEAVIKITKYAQQEGRRSKGMVRFEREIVPSAPSVRITGLRNPLEVYNDIARDDPILADEQFTRESFIVNGESITDDLGNWKGETTVYTHCEVTLAVHLLQLPAKPSIIVLGVSKACCFFCVVFLQLLAQRAGFTIVISGTHSKCYGPWQFPAGLAVELRDAVRSAFIVRARERLNMFLRDVAMTRRSTSDSQYHSSGESGDSDIEADYLAEFKGMA